MKVIDDCDDTVVPTISSDDDSSETVSNENDNCTTDDSDTIASLSSSSIDVSYISFFSVDIFLKIEATFQYLEEYFINDLSKRGKNRILKRL